MKFERTNETRSDRVYAIETRTVCHSVTAIARSIARSRESGFARKKTARARAKKLYAMRDVKKKKEKKTIRGTRATVSYFKLAILHTEESERIAEIVFGTPVTFFFFFQTRNGISTVSMERGRARRKGRLL